MTKHVISFQYQTSFNTALEHNILQLLVLTEEFLVATADLNTTTEDC